MQIRRIQMVVVGLLLTLTAAAHAGGPARGTLASSGQRGPALIPITNHPIKNWRYRRATGRIIRERRGEERLVRLRGLRAKMREDFKRTEQREHFMPARVQRVVATLGTHGRVPAWIRRVFVKLGSEAASRGELQTPRFVQRFLAWFGDVGARHGFVEPQIPTTDAEVRDWVGDTER